MATFNPDKLGKIKGTKKNDKITWQSSWKRYPTMYVEGRLGNDVIDFSKSKSINIIGGSKGNDTIKGGKKTDAIEGGPGADKIWGNNGKDAIDGGTGNDSIIGGEGNDSILGSAGKDTIHGGSGKDSIWGGTGDDSIIGDSGDDKIYGGAGADKLKGGTGDDTIYGQDGADEIWGNYGNNKLFGGAGNDIIHDGTGSDTIEGGAGDDKIFLKKSNGNHYGSEKDSGNDKVYCWTNNNTIEDGSGSTTVYFEEESKSKTNTLDFKNRGSVLLSFSTSDVSVTDIDYANDVITLKSGNNTVKIKGCANLSDPNVSVKHGSKTETLQTIINSHLNRSPKAIGNVSEIVQDTEAWKTANSDIQAVIDAGKDNTVPDLTAYFVQDIK